MGTPNQNKYTISYTQFITFATNSIIIFLWIIRVTIEVLSALNCYALCKLLYTYYFCYICINYDNKVCCLCTMTAFIRFDLITRYM